MDIVDFLQSVWKANLDPSAGVVANWASVISLLVILFNTWRLSKISRFIEHEREKIEDIVKPFDLYCEIQEAIQDLQRHGPYDLISDERKSKILEGLAASKSCLDLYFRQIHDFRGRCENIYLAAAHRYWDRKNTDKALENFKKAAERAGNDEERAECLYGLRACYARKKQAENFARIDQQLTVMLSALDHVPPAQYARSRITMTFVYLQSYFRSKDGGRESVLPGNFAGRFGYLSRLLRRGHFLHRKAAADSQVDRHAEN